MTIDEATEINKDTYHQYEKHLLSNQRDAFKLGIEALNRLQVCSKRNCVVADTLLPGETKTKGV